MDVKLLFLIVLAIVDCESFDTKCPNVRNTLGFVRKRRHIVFPDGSDFVVSFLFNIIFDKNIFEYLRKRHCGMYDS